MASGKKNYFRHSFFASTDDKIVGLIAENGKAAYFHFFRILELCGAQCSENIPEKFTFHRRTLCAELMVTNSRLGHHLLAIQSSLLLQYAMDARKVEMLIPNYKKYLGKYETKNPPNVSNKRKEKEIKVKEIKVLTKINETSSIAPSKKIPLTRVFAQNYKKAFFERWGVEPIVGVKERSQMKKIIQAIGKEDAEKLATEYLAYDDAWIIKQKHPLGALLLNLSKVKVEMNNPDTMLHSRIVGKVLNEKADDYEDKIKGDQAKLQLEWIQKRRVQLKETHPEKDNNEIDNLIQAQIDEHEKSKPGVVNAIT